jgi:dihydrofolate reductase
MLIYSMSVSMDGFIADREGAFGWSAPGEEQFRFHIAQVRELGGCLFGRRLYETMLVWETDASLRDNEPGAAFADVWCAIPKVVFSRTLDSVQGNARLAEASLAEEVARRSTRPTRTSRSAAPAWPRRRSSKASSTSCACSAIRSSSVTARRSCRRSPNTSRWN